MRTIYAGHEFELDQIGSNTTQHLQFVQKGPKHPNKPGVVNQEVLRALISRVKILDKEIPWEGNKAILHHLRMALVLHESRALGRKVEKGELLPEEVEVGLDGHFKLEI